MFIKQLTIHGFKSYRDQVIVGPFSPGLNVVVGRNGSGKSNFFAAIRFVLGDAYSKLGQEERQALLHEGGGANQIAGYVEVVFDNGDGRFPTGKDEVTIRRTVGLKKDEYSLDKKPVTKTDIMNLLQSAGFSKSNPYYIVPQGRITALTNAKDAERLALLKEVAGTRVYEEHREESLKIMRETEGKRQRITELLESIKTRLAELEGEREELAEFNQLERSRKACEHVLYTRDLERAINALAKLEAEYKDVLERGEREDEAGQERLGTVQRLEAELEVVRQAISRATSSGSDSGEIEGLRVERTRLELAIADEEANAERFASEEARLDSILLALEGEIFSREAELGRLAPFVGSLEAAEQEARSRLSATQHERQALLGKKGRLGQFRTEQERNRWLSKELEGVQAMRQVESGQRSNLLEEIESYGLREADLAAELKAIEDDDPATRLARLDAEWALARQERDAASEARKELWRAQAKLEASLAALQEEVERLSRSAASSPADRAARQSVEVAMRLAESLGLSEQVYGPLYELFTVPDELFRGAADETAGTSLFHLVVADDAVASRLIEAMLESGTNSRVTFMPLSRLTPKESAPMETDEAVPLLSRLDYDPKFSKAMQQVFGRTIVCKDLQVASKLSRQLGLDAITLAGDKASRKGALTGGSSSKKTARLDALWKMGEWRGKEQEMRETLQQVKHRILATEQLVTAALSRLQKIECQRQDARLASTRTHPNLQAMRSELDGLQQILASKRSSLARLDESLGQAEHKAAALEAEIASPFANALEPAEEAKLSQLSGAFDELSALYAERSSELSKVLQAQTAIESELEGNLRKRRHAILSQKAQVSTAALSARLNVLRSELEALNERLSKAEGEAQALAKQLTSLRTEEAAIASALEKASSLADSTNMDDQQAMARYTAKQRNLQQKRLEASEKLRALGVLPEDADLSRLSSLPDAALTMRLAEAREALKAFGPVNRKAAEQHASFSKQGAGLEERLAELEASAAAITDFIKVLDSRKDEALQRTFEQVSEAFSLLFARLVPAGHAALSMIRAPDAEGQLQYTGIGMRASFNSQSADEGLLLGQLSGGQKSLLALALILAIQQTDPAPFYLFDEVDAALDSAHRTALACLLDSMSHPPASEEGAATKQPSVQFICTTFRAEMLQRADAFFGVSFGSRISRVEQISQEQALDFVETEALV